MLHVKTKKKVGKWPQINQVLVNSKRKVKWAASTNKENPTTMTDNQSITVIYEDTAFKIKESKSRPVN